MNQKIITPEDIREAEGKLLATQLSGDIDTLSQLLYDDLTALSPTGQVMTKENDLNAYRSGVVVLKEASAEIESIRITGDTAVSVVTLQAKGTVMGNPLEGSFRYMRVWKHLDDGLKIIAAAYMQVS